MGVRMNLRPLFWMMVGAVATLVSGAWGGKQFLPIPGELHHTAPTNNIIRLDTNYVADKTLRRTPWLQPKADPFGEKPKAAPPRKVAPVVENREPPPLVFPFEYVGKLLADGKETLYLSKGDQVYPVAEGAILDSLFRVDHIGNGAVELSYIPDSRKMTITLESITAKPVPGAAIMSPGMTGTPVALPFPMYNGREDITPPGTGSSPTESDVMQSMANPPLSPDGQVLQQQNAAPPLTDPMEVGMQSTASQVPPAPVSPGMEPPMMPPGMMPPGMIPGVPQ